ATATAAAARRRKTAFPENRTRLLVPRGSSRLASRDPSASRREEVASQDPIAAPRALRGRFGRGAAGREGRRPELLFARARERVPPRRTLPPHILPARGVASAAFGSPRRRPRRRPGLKSRTMARD